MTLFDFLLLLFGVMAAGLFLTAIFLTLLLRRIERKIASDFAQALEQAQPRLIPLLVEKRYGIFYCYNADNQEFVCQGETVDELRAAFRARFPHHTAVIADGEESVIDLLREAINKDKHEVSSSQ